MQADRTDPSSMWRGRARHPRQSSVSCSLRSPSPNSSSPAGWVYLAKRNSTAVEETCQESWKRMASWSSWLGTSYPNPGQPVSPCFPEAADLDFGLGAPSVPHASPCWERAEPWEAMGEERGAATRADFPPLLRCPRATGRSLPLQQMKKVSTLYTNPKASPMY